VKKLVALLLAVALVMAVALVGCAGGKEEARDYYLICITQIVTHPDLDTDRESFMAQISEENLDKPVQFIVRNAEGDMTTQNSIASYFVSLKPDLIHSITTPSSQAVVAAAKGTTIPIVFGTVTDPVAAGLVPSWEEAADYVTGVSDWADVPTQIDLVLEVLPELENLGVIYNPGETNSVVQVTELKNEIAPAKNITIVEAPAENTAAVYTAAMSLVGRVDAIWIPTDNTATAAIDSIVSVCNEHHIPFFGSTRAMAVSGCCAAVGVDYSWIGTRCAEMAGMILRGEKTPKQIPPEKCEMGKPAVNLAAAAAQNVTIPQSVLDRAEIVG
jgi:putative ABC transport system substrate-binding protein